MVDSYAKSELSRYLDEETISRFVGDKIFLLSHKEIRGSIMKRYKLKKDLPTFKAGGEFVLDKKGLVYGVKGYDGFGNPYDGILAYSWSTLEKFPNILTDWFEEIPEKPKTVWDLEEGDRYYYISDRGSVHISTWYDCDIERREAGDAFLTSEEAEKELAWRKAREILKQDTKGFKPDWELNKSGFEVYIVRCGSGNGTELTACRCALRDGTIRFATREDAEESIRKHEKEWKIYLGVEE